MKVANYGKKWWTWGKVSEFSSGLENKFASKKENKKKERVTQQGKHFYGTS